MKIYLAVKYYFQNFLVYLSQNLYKKYKFIKPNLIYFTNIAKATYVTFKETIIPYPIKAESKTMIPIPKIWYKSPIN